jgi:xanthine dehydrogenase YagS FAD-binding subunit
VLPAFTYVRPASLREAIRELGSPDARLHAGGTDLLGCLRDARGTPLSPESPSP